jgi:predicted secreted protein
MSLVGGLMIYVILWWMVLFTVLPFGVRTVREEGGEMIEGQAASAPARPRILTKMVVTTLISAVIMAVVVAVVEAELIDFRGYFKPPG